MRIVFAKEAREVQNGEDKAEHPMAATGHLLEDMMATCHQLGVAGEVAETSFNTQSDSFGRYTVDIVNLGRPLSFGRETNTCIVLAQEACKGPNTPDQTLKTEPSISWRQLATSSRT